MSSRRVIFITGAKVDLAFIAALSKKQLIAELRNRVGLIGQLREHRDALLNALKDAQEKTNTKSTAHTVPGCDRDTNHGHIDEKLST